MAVARSDKTGYYYAVQMFGRPKSLALRFNIAHESPATVSYRIADHTFTLPPGYIRTHEQCRPTEVTFELSAGGKTETEVFRAENDDQFVIVDDGGALRVKRLIRIRRILSTAWAASVGWGPHSAPGAWA